MFVYVFVGTIIVQYLLIELPGLNITFGCTHLEPWMHAFCFLCGLAGKYIYAYECTYVYIITFISGKFTPRTFYIPHFTQELTFEKFQRSRGTWLCITCRMVYTYMYDSRKSTLWALYIPQLTKDVTFEKFQRSRGTWLCITCRMSGSRWVPGLARLTRRRWMSWRLRMSWRLTMRKTLRLNETRHTWMQHTAKHCNTFQHTTTHCNTLQHTATHCHTLMNEACHTCTRHDTHEWGMSHMKRRITHRKVCHTHMNEACHICVGYVTHEWGMAHECTMSHECDMSHEKGMSRMNESCPAYK